MCVPIRFDPDVGLILDTSTQAPVDSGRARRTLHELASGKFAVVDERFDKNTFGSRYVTFHRAPESLRLSWDGKEEFLVLEWTPDEEQASLGMWEDVAPGNTHEEGSRTNVPGRSSPSRARNSQFASPKAASNSSSNSV